MDIIYISCLCTKKVYKKLFSFNNNPPGQQVQKYHKLLVEGLSKIDNNKIKVVSALPVSKSNTKKMFVLEKAEEVDGINYRYLFIINIPIIKNVFVFIESFISTLLLCLKSKQSVIISDALNISVTAGSILASKITKNKNIGIVTDLPQHLTKKNSIICKVNNYIIRKFDMYIFLTEQMNNVINKKNKPYVIIEGLTENIIDKSPILEKKHENKKVIIYAGSLHVKYGIKSLVEAFLLIKKENYELHIFGDGDYKNELIEITKLNRNITYFGVKANDYVVEQLSNATALINPRQNIEEFTKYSFPSKNMEYMSSGMPIIAYKLDGIPNEYDDYIYYVEDNSIEKLKDKIIEVCEKSSEELYEFGSKAKEFVFKEKNSKVQAQKILNMVNYLS